MEKRKGNKVLRKTLALAAALSCSASAFTALPARANTGLGTQIQSNHTERTNLALDAEFSGTGTGLNKLNDGNLTNFWDGGVAPGHFIANLKHVCLIDEITAFPLKFHDNRYYNYEIAVSMDGVNYETIAVHETGIPSDDDGDTFTFETPVQAQFVKVTMTYNDKNPSVHMSEIQIFGTVDPTIDPVDVSNLPRNLALQKPVIASGQNAFRITDGDRGSWNFWDGGAAPNSFTIDLGKGAIISKFWALPFWSEKRCYHYDIYVSQDNREFFKVASKNTDEIETAQGTTFELEKPVKGRYVMVNMIYNSHNPSVHMNEFEVWGIDDPDYTEPEPDRVDNPDNIVKGKSVRTAYTSATAANIIDGDLSTAWNADQFPSYIDIDLEEKYDLRSMQLNFPCTILHESFDDQAKADAYQYKVYGSNDYAHFDELYSKKNAESASHAGDTVDLSGHSYRFIRIYMEGKHDWNGVTRLNGPALSEVQIFGEPTGEETGAVRTGSIDQELNIVPFDQSEYAAPIEESEIKENLYGIIDRTIGSAYRSWFDFELAPELENGNDYFELSMKDGKVLIFGNDGVSLAMGLNHYYKYFANVNVAEQTIQGTMPASIVPVTEKIHKETSLKVRYAFNYCTLSYTFAFFGQDDFQRENDWLALNGVNVVLDLAGQEAAWIKFLQNFGYTVDDAKDWLCGPGYYAWQFMDNMENYGGPVSDEWVVLRLDMARRTQRWKRSLGISTVQQAYAGMVPTNFSEYVDAAILKQGGWCGMNRPDMIRTDGELYDDLADKFYQAQQWALGDTSDYFAVDAFHEGGIRPADLTDDTIASELLSSLLKNHPDTVWMIQAWQNNPTAAMLQGMGENREDHVMVLDLLAASGGFHGGTSYGSTTLESNEFNGTPWIWCALTNYGGNYSLKGNLNQYASDLVNAKKQYPHMKGAGIIPEGTYDTPVVYDLLFESMWEDEPIDVDAWVEKYAERRYGGKSESALQAWRLLQQTYYSSSAETANPFIPEWNNGYNFFASDPTQMKPMGLHYDLMKTVEALELLVKDYDSLCGSEAYLFDLSEVMRQVLADAANVQYTNLLDAIALKDPVLFAQEKDAFLALFDLEDAVQNTNKDQMVGEWIGKADDWSADMDDFFKETLRINAKALLTVWHSKDGSLLDYVHRYYGGLLKDVYKLRWSDYLDYVGEILVNPDSDVQTPNSSFDYYWKWVLEEESYSRVPDQSAEMMKSLAAQAIAAAKPLAVKPENILQGKPVEESYSKNGHYSSLLTDGNLYTYWDGDRWDKEPWVIVDMEDLYTLDSITIVSTWNDSPRYYHYNVYTSTDKENWELAGVKDDDSAATRKGATFEQNGKLARYIKVVGLYNSANESFHLNEILADGTLYQEEQKADKTLLEQAAAYALEAKETYGYQSVHPKVKAFFEEKLAEARTVLANEAANQQEINSAWTSLTYAIHLLEFKADKAALQGLVNACDAIDLDQYEDGENKTAFTEALAKAKAVLENEDALNPSIEAAYLALLGTMDQLELKEFDLMMLCYLIDTVQDASAEDYINGDGSFDAFAAALEQAKTARDNPLSQQQIDEALNDLSNAWLNLRLKPSEDQLKTLNAFVKQVKNLDPDQMDPQSYERLAELAKTIEARLDADLIDNKEADELIRQIQNSEMKPSSNKDKVSSASSVSTSAATGTAQALSGTGAGAILLAWLKCRKRSNK